MTVKEAHLRVAADRIDDAFVNQPSVDIAVRIAIGRSFQSIGDFDRARKQFELARLRAIRDVGSTSLELLTADYNLARLLNIEGDLENARIGLDRVLAAANESLEPDHPLAINALYQMANNARKRGANDEAIERLKYVLSAWRRSGAPTQNILGAMGDLSMAYLFNNDVANAEQLAQQRLRLARRHFAADDLQVLKAHQDLARIPAPGRNPTYVVNVRENVLDAYRRAYGNDHYKTREAMRELASTYTDLGLHQQAAQLAGEAKDR